MWSTSNSIYSLILLCLSVVWTACGGEASVVTYNVGLARGFVSYADERLDPAADAIASLDADAVCLQEVWLREDEEGNWNKTYLDGISDKAAEAFPYSTWERTFNQGEPTGCTLEEGTSLQECAEEFCPDVSPGELADCALEYCGDLFLSTSSGCQACVAANLGNSIEVIVERCLGGDGSAAYDGHNGLLMLSAKEPLSTHHLQFTSTLTTRSVLHTELKLPGVGPIDVFCTHLASDLSSILTYPGTEYASYAEEQAGQIDAMMDFIDTHSTTGQVIVLGDLNTGTDELSDNYDLLVNAGYGDPYVAEYGDTLCTYCDANTLNGGEGDGGETIDHAMLRFDNAPEVISVDRILDSTESVTTSEGAMDLHLSDHYGVQLILSR